MDCHITSFSSSEEDNERLDYGGKFSEEGTSGTHAEDDDRSSGSKSSSDDDSEEEYDKSKGVKDFSISGTKSIVTTRKLKQLHQQYSIDHCIGLPGTLR